MLLKGKQPTESPLKIWARSNGWIKSYRPFEPVLRSCRGNAPMDIVDVQYLFHATLRKTANRISSKNLSKIQRSDQKLWTFSADTVVVSMVHPHGHRRCGVRIPHYFKENSLRKVKKFRRDPTVGSKVMDLLTSTLVSSVVRTERISSAWSRDTMLL
jgi:hypothetical protein